VAPGIRPKAREDHSSFIPDSLNALKDDRRAIFQTGSRPWITFTAYNARSRTNQHDLYADIKETGRMISRLLSP
jgi:hypothetical protein